MIMRTYHRVARGGLLVFRDQLWVPVMERWLQARLVWVKTAKNTNFRPINRYISETIEDKHIYLQWYTNRKSYMGFRLLSISMT